MYLSAVVIVIYVFTGISTVIENSAVVLMSALTVISANAVITARTL